MGRNCVYLLRMYYKVSVAARYAPGVRRRGRKLSDADILGTTQSLRWGSLALVLSGVQSI